MKKLSILIVCSALLFAACESAEEARNREFAERFAQAIQKNDTATLNRLYPEAMMADSLALKFVADSLEMETNDAGDTIRYRFGKDVTMVVVKDSIDSLHVVSSQGIFAYPTDKLDFAKKTGQWKKGLNDVEQNARMTDDQFLKYIIDKVSGNAIEELESKVRITQKSARILDDTYVMCTVAVSNDSDKPIDGNEYSVGVSITTYEHFMESWIPIKSGSKTLTGKPIPPGGKAVYSWRDWGSMGGAKLSCSLHYNPHVENTLETYQPTGKEYEEYLSTLE